MCYAGQCSISVCVESGLEMCSCSVEEELCQLCCKKDGVCTPAYKVAEVCCNMLYVVILLIGLAYKIGEE